MFLLINLEDCIFAGVDLYGGDNKCVPAATYSKCSEMCMSELNCRTWSFSTYLDYKKCFLKREETMQEDIPIGASCNSVMGFKSSDSRFCDPNGK